MTEPGIGAAAQAKQAEVTLQEGSRSRGRSVGAVICLLLAVVLTTPAAVAFWGQRTLTDTERYVATVGPLVNSPEVQSAVATAVADAIEQQVDIEAVINDVFAGVITDRPKLAALVGPLAGAVNGLIEKEVQAFVTSQAFADIWVTVNTRAQQAFVRLLEGDDSGAVSLQDGQVVLDVSEVIAAVQQRLVDRGLTAVQNLPIPQVDKQIVLMDAPRLQQARNIYAFANPVAKWLIIVVALLYLAAYLLARRRGRMAVWIGLGLIANALLVGLGLSIGRQLFINGLAGTTFGPASAAFYDILLTYLDRGWRVMAWIGAILVAAGWFTGRNAPATALRGTLATGLEGIGATQATGPAHGFGRWVAKNIRWLRWAITVLAVIVLFWGNDVSLSRLFWVVFIESAVLLVLQILVGVGKDAAIPASAATPESVTA